MAARILPISQADGHATNYDDLTPQEWHKVAAIEQVAALVGEFGVDQVRRWVTFVEAVQIQQADPRRI